MRKNAKPKAVCSSELTHCYEILTATSLVADLPGVSPLCFVVVRSAFKTLTDAARLPAQLVKGCT
jgi:hypothetical protein